MKSIKEYATIHIENSQLSEGVTKKTDFSSDCEFYEKDGIFHITYKEPSDIGTGGARVFLKIQDTSVSMRRMGEFKSVMVYELGKTTDALYKTPFGNMDMKISTSSIENDIPANGGILKMKYALMIGGEKIENEMHLEIKKEQKI